MKFAESYRTVTSIRVLVESCDIISGFSSDARRINGAAEVSGVLAS